MEVDWFFGGGDGVGEGVKSAKRYRGGSRDDGKHQSHIHDYLLTMYTYSHRFPNM